MSSEPDIDNYHLGCFQQSSSHHNPNMQTKRRSSYSNSHFAQPLSSQGIIYKDSCSIVSSQDNLGCSPSHYDCYGNRPQLRYEENICCIPPSPAPNSDRFVIGISAPQHRLMVQQQQQQRTMSPSSRYRVQDRYRDVSSPGHFLVNSTPLSSNDNYATYLSSAVHTPVKRYIPTPPLCTTDQVQYNDQPTLSNPGYHLSVSSTQNSLNQIGSSQTLKPQKSRNSSQQQQQPQPQSSQYRINMKCCSDKQQITSSTLPLNSSNTDHYATTPRIRSNMSSMKSNQSTASNSSSSNAACCSQTQSIMNAPYISRDYSTGITKVITPVNMMNQTDQSCINCRRTTGVHQQTQTGPISPIPPQQLTLSAIQDSHQSQSPISPQPSTHSMASAKSGEQTYSSSVPLPKQPEKIEEEPTIAPSPVVFANKPLQQATTQQEQSSMSHLPVQQESSITGSNRSFVFQYHHDSSSNLLVNSNANQRNMLQQQRQQNPSRYSRKQKVKDYVKREIAKFFGVDILSEEEERIKWFERQKRLAIRCFGQLRDDMDCTGSPRHQGRNDQQLGYRPDILPQNTDESERTHYKIEKKASVATMMWNGVSFLASRRHVRKQKQWSRSFAPAHVKNNDDSDLCDGISPLPNDETFFDSPNANSGNNQDEYGYNRQLYSTPSTSVRSNGWQIKSSQHEHELIAATGMRPGTRISAQLLDGIMDNSRRQVTNDIKLLRPNELDDRHDYRPFFTYWVNTVQILVLVISLICYGVVSFGIGMEQKTGQVMVTNLNLQQVSHQEQRNVWIGPRSMDLVHLGAKFGGCMRRDARVLDVIAKTKRKERETACCIRNDDSGCVQTSQAECSVGGLWPTQKTISTWKKWSPGDGPGGRISGSVCGLDPKFCDAPQSFEWPDDITKWPICRKTNSFSHRSRLKDHTAEHMVCEIIGHPCCTGVYGECRITTKEYCEFINGYFHEEASLCSQVSCMSNVCGMFPFFSHDVPDQFYRLFTSLYLHAGILHLAITIAFQHIFLSDLERLLGPLRTAIIYIASGIAGNLTSAIFVPYRPEVENHYFVFS
ncbi:hypothetical protein ACKWTF_012488 [Chironomus riparius]